MVGKDLANLDKAIDLIAPEVLNLSIREALDINGSSIFARLLRGFLFLFKRRLRGVIIVFNINKLSNELVLLV